MPARREFAGRRILVARAHEHAMGFAEGAAAAYEPNPMARRETLELVRAYYRVSDPKLRKRLLEMTKALAGEATGKKKAK